MLIVVFGTFFWCKGQVCGVYRSYGGVYELILKKDSTFEYNFRFDLEHRWTVGRWRLDGKNIELSVTPILDTVRPLNRPYAKCDSVILSTDQRSNKGYDSLFVETDRNGIEHYTGFSSSQDTSIKLQYLYKRNRLFGVRKNGTVIRGRARFIWPEHRVLLGVRIGYTRHPVYLKRA